MSFKAGDRVQWFSCSAGVRREKRGVIVEIVPAGQRPSLSASGHKRSLGQGGWGCFRNHESYLVRAVAIGVASPHSRLYWPLVAYLQLQPAEDPAQGGIQGPSA